jgi:hypothetical protein
MTGYTNDNLTTLLRDAAARESITPRPAAEVRRHAEQVRTRRRVATVTLAAVVAVAGGVAFQQATSPSGLFTTPAPPATAPPSQGPAPTGAATPTSGPSSSASPSPGTTDDDADSVPSNTASAWPAPPEERSAGRWRPWTLPGYDYGAIVAARMEDGHAVITFDRKQLYTAEQWKTKTGEDELMDFHVVNESTRTRQFVIEDDAPLYGNWLLTDQTDVRRYTPEQLVERINAVLVEQAVQASATPAAEYEPPSVGAFLFHRDRENGPVAFLEESSMYTG